MTIKEMEECGVFDIFSALTSFISRFLEKNHPITKDDIKSILSGKTTENLVTRQKVLSVMQDELKSIIEAEARNNKKFIEEFKKNPNMELIDKDYLSERNQKIKKYMDEILEARWTFLNNKDETIPL